MHCTNSKEHVTYFKCIFLPAVAARMPSNLFPPSSDYPSTTAASFDNVRCNMESRSQKVSHSFPGGYLLSGFQITILVLSKQLSELKDKTSRLQQE